MTDKESPLIGELSESLEDYIEIIYNLIEAHKIARVRDIARAKDVKMSSVVSALKRLDQAGLVNYEAREFVELTESGRDLAARLLKRHNFLTRFLVDVLSVDPETAENDACQMEHAISSETMNRLYEFAEYVQGKTDGFGELIKGYSNSRNDKNDDSGE
ncbi:MAG: metal-dependent transcriptional regulator [candidate division Zixibacteria bacterium]|nr:metal-dependent transcriptional regulator [candidate division Zixibacteria bacterium]